ncbi:MAG: hypothetical protein ABR612_05760 [Chromatocurvus sp.]
MISGIARASHWRRRFPDRGRLRALAMLTCLASPFTTAQPAPLESLLEAAGTLRDRATEASADSLYGDYQEQTRRWLAALLAGGEPRFQHWYSERRTFALAADAADYPFPGTPARGADKSDSAHGAHGGPLIHFTHFNTAAYRYVRDSGLHKPSGLQAITARRRALPAPPSDAMVALTGWWPLAADQATPMPLWDSHAALRPTGANGYLNWPRVALVAPDDSAVATDNHLVRQFAGRPISDPRVLPRDAFFRIRPSPAHLQALMADGQFRRASTVALGRPMRRGDELALVAFHLLHFGLDEGLWLTYWWDAESVAPRSGVSAPRVTGTSTAVPEPWRHYRGNMTMSPVHPREPDGSPNICFNPWFDAVFPDSGQGNGLKANCLSCHLRAGIPAAGRIQVTRGRPDLDKENDPVIYTHLLWSLANPARFDAQKRPR